MAEISPEPLALTAEEKTWAMLAHLLALVLYAVVLGQYIAPLVIYMLYKEKSRFVAFHALQSLYFQLALIVVWILGVLLTILTCGVGIVVVIAVAIGSVVLMIMAAVKANRGELYEYWLVGRWARNQVGI